MPFRIYNNINRLQESLSNEIDRRKLVTETKLQESLSTEIDSRKLVTETKLQQSVSTEIDSRMLVTINDLQQSVSTEIDSRMLVTINDLQQSLFTEIDSLKLFTETKLQESLSTEIDSRKLVTETKLQESLSTEIDSRMLVTIDELNARLQSFLTDPPTEINKIKIIDISTVSTRTFHLQNGDEFVVLTNNRQVTDTSSIVYLPVINGIVGIEITIVNLSANDCTIKTLVDDNGDYFYDNENLLQSSICLFPNYSLRFISYMSNKWVNIV